MKKCIAVVLIATLYQATLALAEQSLVDDSELSATDRSNAIQYANQTATLFSTRNEAISSAANLQSLKDNSTPTIPPNLTDNSFKQTTNDALIQSSEQSMKFADISAESINNAASKALKDSKLVIPKLTELGYDMRDGKALTTSANGDAVISLIRYVINNPQTPNDDKIQKIKSFSDANIPEAQNFMGFVYEHGFYGYKKNPDLAFQYFKMAALKKYEPAFYNLSLMYAYGKNTQVNLNAASSLLSTASNMVQDTSFRVCSMYAFVNYKLNQPPKALKAAQACQTPLANLVKASYDNTLSLNQRVGLLRTSLSTGVDDAYNTILKISIDNNSLEGNQIYCKYKLIHFYANNQDFPKLRNLAEECALQTKSLNSANNLQPDYKQYLDGVTGVIPMEVNEINISKRTNHFHYSWSVPYLPFTATEATNLEALKKL